MKAFSPWSQLECNVANVFARWLTKREVKEIFTSKYKEWSENDYLSRSAVGLVLYSDW
jgi:hypothetical protein